jgi:hypothetical protein
MARERSRRAVAGAIDFAHAAGAEWCFLARAHATSYNELFGWSLADLLVWLGMQQNLSYGMAGQLERQFLRG